MNWSIWSHKYKIILLLPSADTTIRSPSSTNFKIPSDILAFRFRSLADFYSIRLGLCLPHPHLRRIIDNSSAAASPTEKGSENFIISTANIPLKLYFLPSFPSSLVSAVIICFCIIVFYFLFHVEIYKVKCVSNINYNHEIFYFLSFSVGSDVVHIPI